MNLQKKKKTGTLKGRLKRGVALVMSVLMISSTPVPGLSLVAHADPDLMVDGLRDIGGGLTTAYKYMVPAKDSATYKFNIEGISDSSRVNNPQKSPYSGDPNYSIRTTYDNSGYNTFVRAYDGFNKPGAKPSDPTTPYNSERVSLYNNGGIALFAPGGLDPDKKPNKDLGIQVQMKLFPSDDQQWIIVEYLVHNTRDQVNPIQIGTTADIMLGGLKADHWIEPNVDPANGSKISVADDGVHMINRETQQTLDCMFNYPGLNLDKPDHIWVGDKAWVGTNLYTDWNHNTDPAPESHEVENQDSSLAYSWNLNLQPKQTVSKRVAFRVKGPSYYVSNSGSDSDGDGTYRKPVRTIEQAIKLIENNKSGNTVDANQGVFIYMQSDYTVNQTIKIPKKFAVTIRSTDYDTKGLPVDESVIHTITRGAGLKDAMFDASSGGDLRVENLTLDGGNAAAAGPILSASHGSIAIGDGATLQNNQVTAAGMGSAVNVTGDAGLDISGGTLTGNKTLDRGAVNFNSTGSFTMSGSCDIENNTNAAGEKANVYLAPGAWITVQDSLSPAGETPSKIGVTAEQIPTASFKDQPATNASQEVKVAVPRKKTGSSPPSPPVFTGNFFLDKGPGGGAVPYLATGTANLPGAGSNNNGNLVLRRDGLAMNFKITTRAGDPVIANPPTVGPLPFAAGDPVTTPPAPSIQFYTLGKTTIEQGATSTLQAAGPEEPNPGTITGTMPAQAVTVTYEYNRMKAQITLVMNGGMTADGQTQIPVLKGDTNDPVPDQPNGPVLHKEGYTFLGWSEQNNGPGSTISWPAKFPEGALTLYAIFTPDQTKKYDYTKEYTDNKGTFVFKTETAQKAHSVEDPLALAAPIKVAGYSWDPASSSTNPPVWPAGSTTPVGTFDQSGNFTGTMPAANLTVRFGYKPDPAKEYPLTVNYVSTNGTVLYAPEHSAHIAGAPVTANPRMFTHYSLSSARLDKGADGSETAEGLVIGVQNPPKADQWQWDDHMPNQEVEITYVYEGDKTPFKITESYVDDTATDPKLQTIQASENTHLVNEPVSGVYNSPYGYTEVPAKRRIALADTQAASNLAFGSGLQANQWSGAMPATDVGITYHHTRTAGKWADLTYQAGKNGTLAKDNNTSSDVISDGGSGYKASILLHGADDTGNAGYTWQMIQDKYLAPAANPNTHYTFEGWFVDGNTNGIRDNGEALVEPGKTFTQVETLTASFVKIPAEWMDVHFTAEKGNYVSGDQTQNIPIGTTWSQLNSLPVYSAWTHYVEDGWYTKDAAGHYTRVDESKPLEANQTYIHRFKPGTDQFAYKTDYSSASGLLSFSIDGGRKPIDDPAEAENKTVQGYTLDKTNTTTDPLTYAFDGTNPVSFGSFDPTTWNYLGHMPGTDLTVHYKYTPDRTQQRTLTVRYETQTGVVLHDPFVKTFPAEESVTLDSEVIPGYTCTSYEFINGKTAPQGELITTLKGEPAKDGQKIYRLTSKMPNQDVTLVYRYTGDTPHKITQTYVDNDTTDQTLANLQDPIVSDPTDAGVLVSGSYVPPYGYTKADSVIQYNPANPAGANLKFTDAAKTRWSGNMPAADVNIIYSHTRNADKWAAITWKAGSHGSLSGDGQSPDLKPLSGKPGVYTASVLKNDGTAGGQTAAYTLGTIKTKKLIPIPTPENADLYSFEGWFVDGNDNGVLDNGETLVPDARNFTGDTTLTASFKENSNKWMDIQFAAEKGSLGTVSPQITHIPKGTTWGQIKTHLPVVTPWTNYTFDNWYDGPWHQGVVSMKDGDVLTAGHTYTAHSIPNPATTYSYTVKYTNGDGSLTFKTLPAVSYSIEHEVTASAIQVPGYVYDQKSSTTDPSDYQFDQSGTGAQKEAIGTFGADGSFIGKMPGQNLTVYYRYQVAPKPPKPEQYPFTLTVKYHSAGGTMLKPDLVTQLNAEDSFSRPSLAIDHYTCTGFTKDTGWTADPEHGVQSVQTDPVKTADGYTWDGKMPNQNVTLTYTYTGKQDPTSKFSITENYIDVTDPAQPKLISSSVRSDIPVDKKESGQYLKPYGYDKKDFKITLADPSVQTNLAFGTGGNADKWSGNMPASNVTITYNSTRHTKPTPDDPKPSNWAAMTYQKTAHGTLSAPQPDVSPDVTTGDQGVTYTTQILVSDGTVDGIKNAYTWQTLKDKKLIPTATADKYYQFAGWYIDTEGNGILDTTKDTYLGKGDATDSADANATFFTGPTTLIASFTEIPDQWIDIGFAADRGTLGPVSSQIAHIPNGTTWSQIKDHLPLVTPWSNYTFDSWYDGAWKEGAVPMKDGDVLAAGHTYTARSVSNPVRTYSYTVKYTNGDGSLTFKTLPAVSYSIEHPVTASAITVPGYVYNQNSSTTDPLDYQFDQSNPDTPKEVIGTFGADGSFTGKMPGQNLTVYYRYDVAPKPPTPEQNPFVLTVRYYSAGGTRLKDDSVTKLNAEENINMPSPAIDHYTCTSYSKDTGWTPDPDNGVQGVQIDPVKTADGYTWNTKMPNQDVTLTYIYTGNQDPQSKFSVTEKYMDVTDPAAPREISSKEVYKNTLVDTKVEGQYVQPYGYDKADFKIVLADPAIQTNLAFGADGNEDKWSGAMPATNVTIIYNNTRHVNPDDPTQSNWATMTYKKTNYGSLSAPSASVSNEVTTSDGGMTYNAPILVSDGTPEGDAGAYTWKDLKEKKLIPLATADTNYQFSGWYIDKDDSGTVTDGDTFLGKGDASDGQTADSTFFHVTDPKMLLASFTEDPKNWITIQFAVENGELGAVKPNIQHVPKGTTWGDIKAIGLPEATAWNNYKFDNWYGGNAVMQDTDVLTDKNTYTARFIPDPQAAHQYTVTYTNEDGSIVFDTVTDSVKYPVTERVTATLKSVPGYEWDPNDPGETTPPDYQFNPNEAATPIGTFDSSGNFIGKMPGQDLTVRYKYKLKQDAAFHLTILYETEKGVKIHKTRGPESLQPGDDITTSPEPVEGYNCIGFRFDAGKFTEGKDGSLLQPVKGEPDPNQGYQWSSKMTNQDVTLVYLYKGDESARHTITERYVDVDAAKGSQDIIPPVTHTYQVGAEVNGTYPDLYGYEKIGKPVLTSVQPWDGDITITIGGDGSWSGAMLPRDVVITYSYRRASVNPDNPDQPDKDHPWADLTYLPGRNGILNRDGGVSSDVKDYDTQSGGTTVKGYKASILLDNGTQDAMNHPYTFGDIKTRKLIPNPKADNYYQFEGWFVDGNGDGLRDAATEPLFTDDSKTFSVDSTPAERTLTASFVENPNQWIHIKFAGEHAVITGVTTLKIQYDKHWSDVISKLPAYTPEANYLVDGWYAGDTKVDPGMPLVKDQTYTIVCYQDPEIFGTKVETPDVSGGLGGQGKGRVTVYDTKEGAYQYILTNLDGTILKVVPNRSASQKIELDGLQPGTRYNVYEAIRTLAALPGDQIDGLGEEGKAISAAAQALTPVLDGNYQVYYNDGNEDEAKARLLIKPADPDSDYAVLDSQGQVVQIPGAQEGGWMAPSGSSPSIEIPGLVYGGEYTIVSRPKGQTGTTAESRKKDGTVITADPIGDLALNNYIIQTTQGTVIRVGETQVEDSIYKEAHKGDTVTLSAPAVNEAGESFVSWKTTIGSLNAQGIDLRQQEVTFPMPAANLVMTPVYDHNPAPDASASGEMRGGNKFEIALDPNEIPGMERELTQDKDRELIHTNGADVTYKVVYKKSGVKSNEAALIKESDDYLKEHKDAFHAAWGLDVSMERYVNGRKVDPATSSDAVKAESTSEAATPSDAAVQTVSFDNPTPYRTYIQMGKGDVDMLDYQLYEITPDKDGVLHAVLVPVSPAVPAGDPNSSDNSDNQDIVEQDGGLFTFEAKVGSRYVMVYNRAYHLYFSNELPMLDAPQYYNFKVRQNESPKASYYAAEYGDIPEPTPYVINNKSGAEYRYKGWYYRQKGQQAFDPYKGIKNTTHVVAYYTDNEKAVADERIKLEQTIDDALSVSRDPFIKSQDKKDLLADIDHALGILQQEDPRRALESELQSEREKLLERIQYYKKQIEDAHKEFDEIQDNSGGGGSSGGGGGGHGVRKDPFNAVLVKNYTVGNNGDWEVVKEIPGQGKKWAFILNGGYKLKSMWAYIKYPEVTNSAAGWYHFNSDAIMDTGWFQDEAGKWYYSYKLNEGPEGKLSTGWHLDAADGHWYYLDPVNGDMVTGWKQIDGKWYALEAVGTGAYVYNSDTDEWIFGGGAGHPLGSMYQTETTPDGYKVDENGVWIP